MQMFQTDKLKVGSTQLYRKGNLSNHVVYMYIIQKKKYFGGFIAKSGFGLLQVFALLFLLEMGVYLFKERRSGGQSSKAKSQCEISAEAPQVV